MLIVLSSATDPVAKNVAAELRRRDARFALLNPGAESTYRKLCCTLTPRGSRLRLPDSTTIDTQEIDTVWNWRPQTTPQEEAQAVARWGSAQLAGYIAGEWVAILADVLRWPERRWIPGPPTVLSRADGKLYQLQVAQALELRIPETLITNDVDEALDFIERCDGYVIHKAPSVQLNGRLLPEGLGCYTNAVKPRDLAGIGAITHAPAMLQARIDKRVELRVTVVGERVFAAEIHSQTTRRTKVDWRRYDHSHTPHRIHALPAKVEKQCLQLTQRLGLRYGAIDLILTPEGEYVFLEINPNGQYAWIEGHTGLPITAALCDELTSGQRQAAS